MCLSDPKRVQDASYFSDVIEQFVVCLLLNVLSIHLSIALHCLRLSTGDVGSMTLWDRSQCTQHRTRTCLQVLRYLLLCSIAVLSIQLAMQSVLFHT